MIDETAASGLLQAAWRQRLPAQAVAEKLVSLGGIKSQQILGRKQGIDLDDHVAAEDKSLTPLRRTVQLYHGWKLAAYGLLVPLCTR